VLLHSMALAVLLCAPPVLSRQAPRVQISPEVVVVDEPFAIAVDGLTPGEDVTTRVEGNRGIWHSSATFRSDAQGRVEVPDPMRFIWSATGDRAGLPAGPVTAQQWIVTADVDGKVVATQTLTR